MKDFDKLVDETDPQRLGDLISAVVELIEDSTTIEQLYDVEEQVGCYDLLGCEDWQQAGDLLSKVHSPFARIYKLLDKRWEVLVKQAMERTRISK